MGKEGDLWDDSALVNAFDDAMSKYKKMHGMHSKDYSTDIGNVAGNTVENASSNDATDCRTLREEADNNYATSGEMLELGEATNSVTDHGLEEYNQLLSQYYELEEKRQVILQKLHQLSGYDTQYPVEGSGSGQQDAEHLAKTGKEEETVQSTSSETDLSVVLNAWYSAGFYSGKYLTEQYIAKKRLD